MDSFGTSHTGQIFYLSLQTDNVLDHDRYCLSRSKGSQSNDTGGDTNAGAGARGTPDEEKGLAAHADRGDSDVENDDSRTEEKKRSKSKDEDSDADSDDDSDAEK